MAYKILVLKGDGIGPEVVGEALQVLKTVAREAAIDLEFKDGVIGGHAIDAHGTPLPDEVLKHAQDADARDVHDRKTARRRDVFRVDAGESQIGRASCRERV